MTTEPTPEAPIGFAPGDTVDYIDSDEDNPAAYRGVITDRTTDGQRWHVDLMNGGDEMALPSEITLVERAAQPEPPTDLSGGGILPPVLAAGEDLQAGDPVRLAPEYDVVEKAEHYNRHPSGVECIDVVRHMSFNLGNALKYVWRADLKGNALEDLKKARYYINDEIAKRERQAAAE